MIEATNKHAEFVRVVYEGFAYAIIASIVRRAICRVRRWFQLLRQETKFVLRHLMQASGVDA